MTMAIAQRSFALCADDYAMTPGVSAGIVDALEAGALTATSVMTTSPWWPEAAAALRTHEGHADIGLHLNLTLGEPLGSMPSLAPDGRLPTIGTLMRLARGRALPLAEIAAEVDRQADCFAAVFGRPPDHVDGHQHVHIFSQIAPLVRARLATRGWRPWLRDSGDAPWRILRRRSSLTKAIGIAALANGYGARAAQDGYATNHGFAGFSPFDQAIPYRAQFSRYLAAPGPRHLVMCHPGYADAALRALDPVVETREDELRFFLSQDLLRVLDEAGMRLARMSAML